jgi:hypothetical protein
MVGWCAHHVEVDGGGDDVCGGYQGTVVLASVLQHLSVNKERKRKMYLSQKRGGLFAPAGCSRMSGVVAWRSCVLESGGGGEVRIQLTHRVCLWCRLTRHSFTHHSYGFRHDTLFLSKSIEKTLKHFLQLQQNLVMASNCIY